MKSHGRWSKAGIASLALFTSCVGPNPAEVATYEAIAPAHRAYVEADPLLDPAQKQARFDLLEAWRLRVGK